MLRFCLFAIILSISVSLKSQDAFSALLPIPLKKEVNLKEKPFDFEKELNIICKCDNSGFIINELKRIIKERTGIDICENKNSKSVIEIADSGFGFSKKEAYSIESNRKKIKIEGGGYAGVFYALQTLDQVLLGDMQNSRNGKIASFYIYDEPEYAYRAVMLDPARHFLPIADVKRFIDNMSKYKYNVLQLHLTDDQGWRIQIKSHPLLTKKGAFRSAESENKTADNGFYTHEELKELVGYALLRNIEIIPELDIPGHTVAFLNAYPETGCAFRHDEEKKLGVTTNMMLCADNEKVYDIYKDIIREVAEIFPSEYIHLGGDEAAIKDNWAKCDDCIALMKKHGYDNPSQLMNVFFSKILDIVRKNRKKAILWCELDNIWPPANEYLFPYPSDVLLVTWRNALTPKCIELTRNHGHSLILAPGEYTYLDYPQWSNDLPEYNNWGMPVTSLHRSYEFNPEYGLTLSERQHIKGVMATLWGEAIKNIDRANYMFFPRGLAIAEAGWSQMEERDWESFKQRLYPNLADLMKRGVSFRVPFEIVE